MIFGLTTNYDKCELIGLRMPDNLLATLADVFKCKIGTFPSTYSGLPLCMGIPKRTLWDPVVERLERKLSLWKG